MYSSCRVTAAVEIVPLKHAAYTLCSLHDASQREHKLDIFRDGWKCKHAIDYSTGFNSYIYSGASPIKTPPSS